MRTTNITQSIRQTILTLEASGHDMVPARAAKPLLTRWHVARDVHHDTIGEHRQFYSTWAVLLVDEDY